MLNKNSNGLGTKDGILAGLPIVIGYFPVAMAFGILSKTTGISLMHSFLFSVLVFAGASQFMALNMLHLGAGIGEIILTTLLVNFRHFLMSASFSARITKEMRKYIPIIAFGITDEFFSVASFKKEELSKEFIISMQLVSYLSWVSGTIFGYMVGQILPSIIKASMGIALYAMFAAILIPEARKSNKILFMAILSGIVNTLLNQLNLMAQGWNMVLAIILVSAAGVIIFKNEETKAYE